MRVLLNIHQTAFQNPGGGEIVVLKHYEHLRKLGADVELFDQWKTKIKLFDVVHCFGSLETRFWKEVKAQGVKLVVTPIIWPELNWKKRIGKRVARIARHVWKHPRNPFKHFTDFHVPDLLLPNSDAEAQRIMDCFGVPRSKIRVIPNGVDSRFLNSNPSIFHDRFGLNDFVLVVGRIAPVKNQLTFLKAMRGTGLQVVIIGSPLSKASEYYRRCREVATEETFFIERIEHDSDLLSSAYAAAGVLAVPSIFETCGIAALEAGLTGARIAITKNGGTKDYFGNLVTYLDPTSEEDIRSAILTALSKPHNGDELREHICQNFLWEKVIRSTLQVYLEVLGHTIGSPATRLTAIDLAPIQRATD